jgi:hypothetical protein
MHEGCNARAFVFVETDGDCALDPEDVYFVTNCAELDRVGSHTLKADAFNQLRIPSSSYDVFEPVAVPKCVRDLGDTESLTTWIDKLRNAKGELAKRLSACLSSNTQYLLAAWEGRSALPATLQEALSNEWERLHSPDVYLYKAHSLINFYTWADTECCLPIGARRATLIDLVEPTPSTAGDAAAEMPAYTQPLQPQANPPKSKKSGRLRTDMLEYKQSAQPYVKAPTKELTPIVENRKLKLAVGDLLIFEEVIGPKTGNPRTLIPPIAMPFA